MVPFIIEVRAIANRTRPESAPKSAALQACLEARDVHMLSESAILELVREIISIFIIDMILESSSDENHQIIVSICNRQFAQNMIAVSIDSLTNKRILLQNLDSAFFNT